MKTNLAQLEQAEMDKVNVDWRQPGWHLKSATICQLSRRRSNVSSQSIYAPWFRERLIAHRLASVSLSRLPYEPKVK